MARITWSELSTSAKAGMVAAGVVETALTVAVWRDLRRRSGEAVRGPKALWVALSLVQPLGPPSYFLLGRRTSSSAA